MKTTKISQNDAFVTTDKIIKTIEKTYSNFLDICERSDNFSFKYESIIEWLFEKLIEELNEIELKGE